jgi:hypothetical protein
MTLATILLDDGEFYVELNANFEPARAPGFLHRRCRTSLTTPGGYECVGSFDMAKSGRWTADLNAPFDDATCSDVLRLGEFGERLNAIAALWRRRGEALCTTRRHT